MYPKEYLKLVNISKHEIKMNPNLILFYFVKLVTLGCNLNHMQ